MKQVWLVKTSSDNSHRYEECITEVGCDVTCIPALHFSFVNESALYDMLSRPNDYFSIIFTSQRAVEAVHKQYVKLKVDVHNAWSKKNVFVVGESTAEAVKEKLQLNSIGMHTGNSHQLADFIIKKVPAFDKPLLFPCSNIKKEDMPSLLVKHDRDFRAITCYETSCSPQLQAALVSALKSTGRADIIVFFSPSSVQHFISALTKAGHSLAGADLVALGPSTNAALVAAGLPVAGVCAAPTPAALQHVLRGIVKC